MHLTAVQPEKSGVAYADERLEIGFNAKYLLFEIAKPGRSWKMRLFLFQSSGDPTLMREGNDMSAVYALCRCVCDAVQAYADILKRIHTTRMQRPILSQLTLSHFPFA